MSPLLANIMLNELDKELEGRGLHFARYADDFLIVVKSKASAERVMHSVTNWVEGKLGLKVNATKTKVARPTRVEYLGFGFYKDFRAKEWKCRPSPEAIARFKRKLKALTSRRWSINFRDRVRELNAEIRGWINYFALAQMKTAMADIDAHLRTRCRMCIWKQWKVPAGRQRGLQMLGVNKDLARLTAYAGERYVFVATKTCVTRAISKKKLAQAGLVSCLDYYLKRHGLKLR